MYKHILAISILAVSCKTADNRGSALQSTTDGSQPTISRVFDFTANKNQIKDFGIDFFFSDYPAGQVTLTTGIPKANDPDPTKNYQLTQHYGTQGKFKGQIIGYSNRSDDVDTHLQIKIGGASNEKLKPNTAYLISTKIDFVTNAGEGAAGAGGSPTANYFGTIVTQNPWIPTKESEPKHSNTNSGGTVKVTVLMGLMDQITDEQQQEEIADQIGDRTEIPQEEFLALVKKYHIKTDVGDNLEGGKAQSGSSDVYVRTETKDENGQVVRMTDDVNSCPSGGNPWICSRLIKMGQVSTGSTSNTWTANSLKTPSPITFKTDSKGSPIYVDVFSHSGFEGVTYYLLTGLQIDVVESN